MVIRAAFSQVGRMAFGGFYLLQEQERETKQYIGPTLG